MKYLNKCFTRIFSRYFIYIEIVLTSNISQFHKFRPLQIKSFHGHDGDPCTFLSYFIGKKKRSFFFLRAVTLWNKLLKMLPRILQSTFSSLHSIVICPTYPHSLNLLSQFTLIHTTSTFSNPLLQWLSGFLLGEYLVLKNSSLRQDHNCMDTQG